jgi:hypothetical protein
VAVEAIQAQTSPRIASGLALSGVTKTEFELKDAHTGKSMQDLLVDDIAAKLELPISSILITGITTSTPDEIDYISRRRLSAQQDLLVAFVVLQEAVASLEHLLQEVAELQPEVPGVVVEVQPNVTQIPPVMAAADIQAELIEARAELEEAVSTLHDHENALVETASAPATFELPLFSTMIAANSPADFGKARLISTVFTPTATACNLACGQLFPCVRATWISDGVCWLSGSNTTTSESACPECTSFVKIGLPRAADTTTSVKTCADLSWRTPNQVGSQ